MVCRAFLLLNINRFSTFSSALLRLKSIGIRNCILIPLSKIVHIVFFQGRKQNTTYEVTLHKSRYTIELTRPYQKYKPGLPYEVTVSLNRKSSSLQVE